MMPSSAQPPPEHPGAVPMPPNSSAPLDAEDPNADGRKAKRELSQSKRAAQNRAAQVRLTLQGNSSAIVVPPALHIEMSIYSGHMGLGFTNVISHSEHSVNARKVTSRNWSNRSAILVKWSNITRT